MKRLYFDWNASAPVRTEVSELVYEIHKSCGNPSSVHSEGRRARSIIEESRSRIRSLLKAEDYKIIFTSGATESNNLAILGFERNCINKGLAPLYISSLAEHSSIIEPLRALERRGVQVHWHSDHFIKKNELEGKSYNSGNPVFVSSMIANNETGHLFDALESKEIKTAHYHCDAVQVLGKVNFSVANVCYDTVTLSSHKIGGPVGAGALLVRDESSLSAIQFGGAQEYSLRAGTENAAAIAGFARAIEIVTTELELNYQKLLRLNTLLRSLILARVPDTKILTPAGRFLPNTLSILFPGLDGRSLVIALDLQGVAASVGSACASGSIEPSHVLLALGFTPEEARSVVRLSFGHLTTDGDIADLVTRLDAVVKRLRV
ncbi:MAG: cysteine desulfurase family protein [Planctomycetota bacterium]